MSTLDPVEVARLLEAAPKATRVWGIDTPQIGDGGVILTTTVTGGVDAASAAAALIEIAPELAADWLRLRTLAERERSAKPRTPLLDEIERTIQ